MLSTKTLALLFLVVVLLVGHANAFGAGNIASISRIEGHNWRHGDIEDMLKTIAFIKGHKWTSMTIKRVYFGNWLRDYSQALDVGTLKGTNAATIRVLVWILSFMSFGYATAEFEVTDERLGVYRPEEHIDNPKDYADNQDARQYDPRLRPPVMPEELEIDPQTGMKNYIANEAGPWATSVGYIKHSFARSIHFGRVYTNGASGTKHQDADLCEALRCLGQGLHCLEDFGAHTNYVELALREMGLNNVFPHVGISTHINLGGKYVYPLVTGTFGGVDFLHSVLGEATDHVTQSEVDEMNKALGDAAVQTNKEGHGAEQQVAGLASLLSNIPNTGPLCQEAVDLKRASDAQAADNARGTSQDAAYEGYISAGPGAADPQYFAPPPQVDAQAVIAKIYPILEFRDKVVRVISSAISIIPGLESLIDKIQEKVTLFIMALLAPYVQPLINVATQQLKLGSSSVIDSSGKHQFEPWTDPKCTDPTHSLLSKDHFSNILNAPAGQVASAILKYCAPRIMYAWENPDIPLDQILTDISQVFHHPATRNPHIQIHREMFAAVEHWVQTLPQHGADLDNVLGSESVRQGKNHIGGQNPHASGGGAAPSLPSAMEQSHSQTPLDLAPPPYTPLAPGANANVGGVDPPSQYLPSASPYPVDYTPYDPSTFSTAYSQGYDHTTGPLYSSQPLQAHEHDQQQQQQQQQGYADTGAYGYGHGHDLVYGSGSGSGYEDGSAAPGAYPVLQPPASSYTGQQQQHQEQQQQQQQQQGYGRYGNPEGYGQH